MTAPVRDPGPEWAARAAEMERRRVSETAAHAPRPTTGVETVEGDGGQRRGGARGSRAYPSRGAKLTPPRLRLLAQVGAIAATLLVALGPVGASIASADSCGSDATITPASGPPGTTFVFRTNLGEPSDIYVYRNGHLVKTDFDPGNADIRYEVTANAPGRWRVRAELRSSPQCAAEATFVVVGTPDTATAGPIEGGSTSGWPLAVLVSLIAGAIACGVAFRRTAPGNR